MLDQQPEMSQTFIPNHRGFTLQQKVEETFQNDKDLNQNRKMTLGMQSNCNQLDQFKGIFGMNAEYQQDNSQFNKLLCPQINQYHNKKGSERELVSIMNIQQIQDQIQDFNELEDLRPRLKTGKFPQKSMNSFKQQDLDNSEVYSLIQSSRSIQQLECDCEAQILIVDDNMFNLIPLELILKNLSNLKVIKAYNGLEAVNIFRERQQKKCCNKKIKLIFMDLNMPIMDGYQATQEILELFNENYPSGVYSNGDYLNIVAITAFVNEENINHCYAVGMKEVLHKPIDEDSLRDIINQYYFTQSLLFYHND
eukprot:403364686